MVAAGSTTVVIPAWNRTDTLARTLQSVCAMRGDFEVVVVDNGSDDAAAVRELIAPHGDARVRLVRSDTNLGAGGGRNAGAREAHGEFVAFVDSDDAVDVDWLERSVALLGDASVAGVTSAFRSVRSDGSPGPVERPKPHGPLLSGLVGRFGGPPTFVLRREVFDAVGGYDERFWYGENLELWVRISAHCARHGLRLACIDDPLSTWVNDGYDSERYDPVRRAAVDLMLEKYAEALRSDRRAHSDLLAVGATISARNGRFGDARRYLVRSFRVDPSPRAAARLLVACVPPLARRRWSSHRPG